MTDQHLPTCPECGSINLAYERKGFVTARLNAAGDTWEVTFSADDGPGWVRCDNCNWQSAGDNNSQHPVAIEAFSVNFAHTSGGKRSEGGRHDLPETELLTVNDLARVLCVPKATIYRWRYMGAGPRGYSIGRYVRFRWADVEAWLKERADESDPNGFLKKMS